MTQSSHFGGATPAPPATRYDLGAVHRGAPAEDQGPFDLTEWERRASLRNPGPFVNPPPIRPPRAKRKDSEDAPC